MQIDEAFDTLKTFIGLKNLCFIQWLAYIEALNFTIQNQKWLFFNKKPEFASLQKGLHLMHHSRKMQSGSIQ